MRRSRRRAICKAKRQERREGEAREAAKIEAMRRLIGPEGVERLRVAYEAMDSAGRQIEEAMRRAKFAAADYGVNQGRISEIKNGKRFADIPPAS